MRKARQRHSKQTGHASCVCNSNGEFRGRLVTDDNHLRDPSIVTEDEKQCKSTENLNYVQKTAV